MKAENVTGHILSLRLALLNLCIVHSPTNVLCVVQTDTQSAQQSAHTPFQHMLPHLHTIYNDIILLNVLTEV